MPAADAPFALESLAKAVNYQRWIAKTVAPYVGRRVLEVGAGSGNMSRWLPVKERLILTDTEDRLVENLKASMGALHKDDARVSVVKFNVIDDDPAPLFMENLDTVVSFNVLEHIEDDALALRRICGLIQSSRAQGWRRVVTFVPAHQWAYGTLDKKYGHHRRYSRESLERLCRAVAPEAKVHAEYFNTLGLAGWFWNGRVLRKKEFRDDWIALFDKLCGFLAPIDDFLRQGLRVPLGQSVFAVMEWGPGS